MIARIGRIATTTAGVTASFLVALAAAEPAAAQQEQPGLAPPSLSLSGGINDPILDTPMSGWHLGFVGRLPVGSRGMLRMEAASIDADRARGGVLVAGVQTPVVGALYALVGQGAEFDNGVGGVWMAGLGSTVDVVGRPTRLELHYVSLGSGSILLSAEKRLW